MCTCFNNDQTLFDMEGAPVSEVVVIEQTLRLPRGLQFDQFVLITKL